MQISKCGEFQGRALDIEFALNYHFKGQLPYYKQT